MTITRPQSATAPTIRTGIIDCDVHLMPRSLDEIRGYMPMPWRNRYSGSSHRTRVLGSHITVRGTDGMSYRRACERTAGRWAIERGLQRPRPVLRTAQPLTAPRCAALPGGDQGDGAVKQARRVLLGTRRRDPALPLAWLGFDITSGQSIFNPHLVWVRTYEVTVEADENPAVESYLVTVEDNVIVLHA
jgi:hypothetical protein